jgi:hypothetical protein
MIHGQQNIKFANRRVQVNEDGLKLNCTHKLLVCTDYFNISGGSIHTNIEKHRGFGSC